MESESNSTSVTTSHYGDLPLRERSHLIVKLRMDSYARMCGPTNENSCDGRKSRKEARHCRREMQVEQDYIVSL